MHKKGLTQILRRPLSLFIIIVTKTENIVLWQLFLYGNKEFCGLAFFGKHLFVFCFKIVFVIAVVKITGDVGDPETDFLKIRYRLLKKHIIIGLEVYLAANAEDIRIHTQKIRRGQAKVADNAEENK